MGWVQIGWNFGWFTGPRGTGVRNLPTPFPDRPERFSAKVRLANRRSCGREPWSRVRPGAGTGGANLSPARIQNRSISRKRANSLPESTSCLGMVQEAMAISRSRKPMNRLKFSGFSSSRQTSIASRMLAIASSMVFPYEWQPRNVGQVTMYTSSSSCSMRMGKWRFFTIRCESGEATTHGSSGRSAQKSGLIGIRRGCSRIRTCRFRVSKFPRMIW